MKHSFVFLLVAALWTHHENSLRANQTQNHTKMSAASVYDSLQTKNNNNNHR